MSEEASEAMYPDTGVELVILRTAGGFVVPVLGVTVFDVASGVEPDEQLLSELLDSSVRVTGWEGYPAALLDALADLPVPPTFRASPWLAHSRPAYIGDDGTGSVANFPVHYTPHRGLRIHHPEADEQLQESRRDEIGVIRLDGGAVAPRHRSRRHAAGGEPRRVA